MNKNTLNKLVAVLLVAVLAFAFTACDEKTTPTQQPTVNQTETATVTPEMTEQPSVTPSAEQTESVTATPEVTEQSSIVPVESFDVTEQVTASPNETPKSTVSATTASENIGQVTVAPSKIPEPIKTIETITTNATATVEPQITTTVESNTTPTLSKTPSEGLEYIENADGTYTVKIGQCTDNDIVIPAYYNGGKVTAIGDMAFMASTNIKSVTIPDGITSIGRLAFSWTSITQINIPASVANIEGTAFAYCLASVNVDDKNKNYLSDNQGVIFNKEKTRIIYFPNRITGVYTIPNSITDIEEGTFVDCDGLTDVIIPDGVISIGDQAFYGCESLTQITIPASVTSIGYMVFKGCKKLKGICVDEGNKNYSNDGFGVLFNKDKTKLICAPNGITGAYTIPNSVTDMNYDAFAKCADLTDIIIPDSITGPISFYFEGCTSLGPIFNQEKNELLFVPSYITGTYIVPNGVKKIRSYAFYNCVNLTSVTIPDSVTSIGVNIFEDCDNLTDITIPESLGSKGLEYFEIEVGEHKGTYAVQSMGTCTDTDIIVPSYYKGKKVTWINDYAFSTENSTAGEAGDRIRKVIIGSGVTYIGVGVFSGCIKLEEVIIPNSVEQIEWMTFYDCSSLREIKLPNKLTSINDFLLCDCSSLEKITIPDGVTSIGDFAFDECTSLATITIPSSVTSIGDFAFSGCCSLNIYYEGTKSQLNGEIDDATVYYYSESQPTEDGNYWHYVDGVPTVW